MEKGVGMERSFSLHTDGERAKRAFIRTHSQQTGDDRSVQGRCN